MKYLLIIILFILGCEKQSNDFVLCQIDAKGKLRYVDIEIFQNGYYINKTIELKYINVFEVQKSITIRWTHSWVYGKLEYNNQIVHAEWNTDSTYKQMKLTINH
jgi:hypothetical protein